MEKTIIIQDSNFYQRLVDLKITTSNKSRQIKLSQLKKVTELDLSDTKIYSVEELSYFERLQKLNLMGTNLETLDLSQNLELRIVLVSGKKLRQLNLGDLKKLHCLHVFGNLDQLIFPCDNELFELSISSKKLKILDLHTCRNLKALHVSGTRLKHLDLSAQSLIYLNVNGNKLKSLDVSNQAQLEYVNAIDNQIIDFVSPPTSSLRYMLLDGNPIKTEYLQLDPAFANVNFSDPHPARREKYEQYFISAITELVEQKNKCIENGSSLEFCFDMMLGGLYELLRKYDRKRRFYRYKKGLIIITFPIVNFLDFLYWEFNNPVFSVANMLYSESDRTYYEEISTLGLDEYPTEIKLKIDGRIVVFDADEIAFTSSCGFPNELSHVRYIERIIGKVRARRSLKIWND